MFFQNLSKIYLSVLCLASIFFMAGCDNVLQDKDGDGYCNPASFLCKHSELDCVDDTSSHGLFVCEDLVLALVIATENNSGSVIVTRFNDLFDPLHISFSK